MRWTIAVLILMALLAAGSLACRSDDGRSTAVARVATIPAAATGTAVTGTVTPTRTGGTASATAMTDVQLRACINAGACVGVTPPPTRLAPAPTTIPTTAPAPTRRALQFCDFVSTPCGTSTVPSAGESAPSPAATPTRIVSTPARTAVPEPRLTSTPVRPVLSATATSAPTVAQLRQALLTAAVLGGDWIQEAAGELTGERYAAAYAEFTHLFGVDAFGVDAFGAVALSIELHDARNGSTEYLAITLIEGEQITQHPASDLGDAGIRYRYQFAAGQARGYGEVVAWRQGSVTVTMRAEGINPATCVCDRAAQQADKLRATFR